MAQTLTTSFISTVTPGAYPNVTVVSNPVGLGSSGNLLIMGEAVGGASYTSTALSTNVFTPDQLAQVTAKYIAGPIVDAFKALAAPSNDTNITGTASTITILKTNTGTQASALIAAFSGSYGTLIDQNWGTPGNLYKYTITTLEAEVAPKIDGSAVPSIPALDSASFTVRLNGGPAVVITISAGPFTLISEVVTALNVAFAAATLPITASPGAAPLTELSLSVNSDSAAYSKGWGKSLELIDSTPGDLAAFGFVAGLTVSSSEPSIEVNIVRPDISVNETIDVSNPIALNIGYLGTTGTVTIDHVTGLLTTAITGGLGAALSIALSNFRTIADLATFISSQTGYTALAGSTATQLPPSVLDTVTAIGIASTGANLMPGRIKDALFNFESAVGTSTALSFIPIALAGLPQPTAGAFFLSNGTKGGTTAADIVNALAQTGGVNINMLIPLFSQDASLDIIAGLTASSSTYTIAAINAGVLSNCLQYSTPKLKKNRICFLSLQGSFANAQIQASSLASPRASLAFQLPTLVNSLGIVTKFAPWMLSVVAAGMQAGGFYKAIVNKYANVISFSDPSDFDSGNPGDVEEALSSGLLFLTADTAGDRWVSDQTTYGFDSNFVYNSIQAMYDADLVSLDLAASYQSAFVGQSLADVSISTVSSFMAQKMSGYLKLKLIAASSDAPVGFKNATFAINGPTLTVGVEIKLATALYFIPISISISQVTQSS